MKPTTAPQQAQIYNYGEIGMYPVVSPSMMWVLQPDYYGVMRIRPVFPDELEAFSLEGICDEVKH